MIYMILACILTFALGILVGTLLVIAIIDWRQI